MKTKGLWYFAHPYTCKDKDGNYVLEGEEANFRLCCWRSAQALLRGYNVYSPIAHTHPIHTASPELLTIKEHDVWYALDNEFVMKTDFEGIILPPGWDNSKGCIAEAKLMRELGREVIYFEDIMKEPIVLESACG